MLNKVNLQDRTVLAMWSEKFSLSSITTFLKELWLMFLTGWANCDETKVLIEPQVVPSWQVCFL